MKPRDLPEEAQHLADLAAQLMKRIGAARDSVVTAESCTGGLVASLLTDLPGLSSAFERGFVTYAERSKCELLGIDPVLIQRHGVVSAKVAAAMADGALEHSKASLAVAITGYAGPGGAKNAGAEEPGYVHLAARRRGGRMVCRECHYGDVGRDRVRMLAANAAVEMLGELVDE
jgi:nicotinamide-nucleotide amidase